MSKELMEVRHCFSKVLNDPKHLNASSREIASGFLLSHRSIISPRAWDEVTKTGLVHIMDGLRRRKPQPSNPTNEPDLFAGFDIEPIVVVRVLEPGKGAVEKNKNLSSLTLSEAMDYYARHNKERDKNTKRTREWRRLINRVKPYMTRDDMTLREGLALAEAADCLKKTEKR